MTLEFKILGSADRARLGKLVLPRGVVDTPAFMPVGTYGTVKSLSPPEIWETGAQIILGNTFHLWLRPGTEIIKRHGDLHDFMQWQLPILTDSGGFQVFSLAELRKITEEGVHFRSPVNGDKVFLSPEVSMQVQADLGSDIVMSFDECTPYPATRDQAAESMELSMRWAARGHEEHNRLRNTNALFGIVQGGMYGDLRQHSAEQLQTIGFDGYAVGGLAVGEESEEREAMLDVTLPHLDYQRPRYLMGVGKPEDIVAGVMRGIDMFDCVLPTRNARNDFIYTRYGDLRLRNARFREDTRPLDESCECYTCQHFSRSYLYHLSKCGEILGSRLNTIHNVTYYQTLMSEIRASIKDGNFNKWAAQFADDRVRL